MADVMPMVALPSGGASASHGVLWLNVIGDAALLVAFVAIPLALVAFMRRRPDLRFRRVFPALALFLIMCALVHGAAILSVWHSLEALSGGLKVAAGATFLAGVAVVLPLVPRMLTVPTAHALQQINAELEHEITLRVAAELDLRAAYQELEERVAQRTRELSASNERLTSEIQERRRTEEALRRLHEDLERHIAERTAELTRSVAELESFSYSISHDLRAPLRAINGYAAIVRDEHGKELTGEGRELLDRIGGNAARMAQLIDGLLDFARLARAEAITRRVDMGTLARSVAAELQVEGTVAPAEIAIDASLPAVRGDEAMLRQVWVNLLSNAVKFAGREQPPRVRVGAQVGTDEVVFAVHDNGVGFDMAYADKLFGVFNRLHSAAEFPGAGVGLAIVRRIVQRHGGRVWAESTPGVGSTFYFAFPAVRDAVADEGVADG